MNRKILLKLVVCDVALAALVLAFSWFFPFGKQWVNVVTMNYTGMMIHSLIYGEMAAPVALVLLTVAFTWATFRISGPCKRWQLVMAVNALICMAAGPGIFAIAFAWANTALLPFTTFSRMMFWTGLLAIALSFPLKRLRRKGLVG
jgi:hypothetical protein